MKHLVYFLVLHFDLCSEKQFTEVKQCSMSRLEKECAFIVAIFNIAESGGGSVSCCSSTAKLYCWFSLQSLNLVFHVQDYYCNHSALSCCFHYIAKHQVTAFCGTYDKTDQNTSVLEVETGLISCKLNKPRQY